MSTAKHGMKWTEEEDFDLQFYRAEGETHEQLAERLDRTAASVAQRILKLKQDKERDRKTPLPWTCDEETILAKMYSEGCSDEEIARRLKRSKHAIASRRGKLGLTLKREKEDIAEDIRQRTFRPEPYTGPSITDISLEAQKQGMSYGQYVAMQYEREAMQSNAK